MPLLRRFAKTGRHKGVPYDTARQGSLLTRRGDPCGGWFFSAPQARQLRNVTPASASVSSTQPNAVRLSHLPDHAFVHPRFCTELRPRRDSGDHYIHDPSGYRLAQP